MINKGFSLLTQRQHLGILDLDQFEQLSVLHLKDCLHFVDVVLLTLARVAHQLV